MQSRFYTANFCEALRQMAKDTHDVCSAVVAASFDDHITQSDVYSARENYERERELLIGEDQESTDAFINYLLSYNKGLVQTFIIDNSNNSMSWGDILNEDFDGNTEELDE